MTPDQLRDTIKGDSGSRYAPKWWVEALKAIAVLVLLIAFIASILIIGEILK